MGEGLQPGYEARIGYTQPLVATPTNVCVMSCITLVFQHTAALFEQPIKYGRVSYDDLSHLRSFAHVSSYGPAR